MMATVAWMATAMETAKVTAGNVGGSSGNMAIVVMATAMVVMVAGS